MNKKKVYIYISLGIVLFLGWIFSSANKIDEDFSERVKVSLRNVGHQLLLSNQDSTSLVLPITELEDSKYKISFQNNLSINPDSLTSIIKQSLKKSKLPKYYRTEVVQCDDNEVAYSYEIKNKKESDIIPCKGRLLPNNCYVIEVKFTALNTTFFNRHFFLLGLIVLLLLFGVDYVFLKPKIEERLEEKIDNATFIGIFQFYPEQNKLVKQATEISLSKKECELLAIFVENPNQIIKRDELMKKVWEDNGVFVGRSLDTYISKLRKKLKEDSSIKITNIHGVGYKLEVN
ncbi:winged helix-turn-helix transcriptional regulator [Tenacibaculum sp. S7007]|uniref:Winged helix-turn-helix transcriptional regulator n=1 Tax=Tenacibaculum pelagium TaxID=2759527 RepID=A0A839AN71_9FLAO|nr:winged helix-turn-helix domain-containing protein [Tenacibaculum pelagium]MBA6155624.1 winged helix-turn-helix transcriptional regulator [Tenacibaculum pelagium]